MAAPDLATSDAWMGAVVRRFEPRLHRRYRFLTKSSRMHQMHFAAEPAAFYTKRTPIQGILRPVQVVMTGTLQGE
jgi:hypothetical protein